MWFICQRFLACPSCWQSQCHRALGPATLQKRPVPRGVRSIYSETGKWEKKYELETRKKIESWWRTRIKEQFNTAAGIDVSMSTLKIHTCLSFFSPESISNVQCILYFVTALNARFLILSHPDIFGVYLLRF